VLVRQRQQVVPLVALDRLDHIPLRVGVRDLDAGVSSTIPYKLTLSQALAARGRRGARLGSASSSKCTQLSRGAEDDVLAEAENGRSSGGAARAGNGALVAAVAATRRRRAVGLNMVAMESEEGGWTEVGSGQRLFPNPPSGRRSARSGGGVWVISVADADTGGQCRTPYIRRHAFASCPPRFA
jgi:hypothetical protein